jgi:hypothetical protein
MDRLARARRCSRLRAYLQREHGRERRHRRTLGPIAEARAAFVLSRPARAGRPPGALVSAGPDAEASTSGTEAID